MTALPKLRQRYPSGQKITADALRTCHLVKIWTHRSVTVGWLVDATSEFADVVSSVPTDDSGNGWRHRIDRPSITTCRVIQAAVS